MQLFHIHPPPKLHVGRSFFFRNHVVLQFFRETFTRYLVVFRAQRDFDNGSWEDMLENSSAGDKITPLGETQCKNQAGPQQELKVVPLWETRSQSHLDSRHKLKFWLELRSSVTPKCPWGGRSHRKDTEEGHEFPFDACVERDRALLGALWGEEGLVFPSRLSNPSAFIGTRKGRTRRFLAGGLSNNEFRKDKSHTKEENISKQRGKASEIVLFATASFLVSGKRTKFQTEMFILEALVGSLSHSKTEREELRV